jgi:hypothetical protein
MYDCRLCAPHQSIAGWVGWSAKVLIMLRAVATDLHGCSEESSELDRLQTYAYDMVQCWVDRLRGRVPREFW